MRVAVWPIPLLVATLTVYACDPHWNDDWPKECPDPDDTDEVVYFHATYEERSVCALGNGPGCQDGWEALDPALECGCGCTRVEEH